MRRLLEPRDSSGEKGMANFLNTAFYGTSDYKAFVSALQQTINQVGSGGVFTGDNLFTYSKNLSFLDDRRFMEVFEEQTERPEEKATVWRTHVLLWAAKRGLKLDGDFMECGTYKGTSARVICDCLDFGAVKKTFYLFDLFEHDDDMAHHSMPEHGESLYDKVMQRFEGFPNVTVTKGRVPDVLSDTAPERIAFLHIDMNDAAAEVGALSSLFQRVVPGAFVVLDDYGWLGYRTQKELEDAFFAEQGYEVLELPTGQGLVIK